MAAAHTTRACIASILLVHLLAAKSDWLSPMLSPVFENVCKEVECGKGSCRALNNISFGFMCECEPGWKQARPQNDSDTLSFLPCVIPNCTLDYSCQPAPAPVPHNEKKANTSFFDPCYWADCGVGSCNKTSAFTHTCNCEEGYSNLLNVTAFPCIRQCSIGMDCANLGIPVTNRSTSSSPSFNDNGNNQAISIPIGNSNWLIMAMMSLAAVLLG